MSEKWSRIFKMDIENSLYGTLCKFFTLVSNPNVSEGHQTYCRFIVPEVEHEAKEKKRLKRDGFSTLFKAHINEEETIPNELQLSTWIFKLKTFIPCSKVNTAENTISDLEKVATGQLDNILPMLKFLSNINPVNNEDLSTLRSINSESYQRQQIEIKAFDMKTHCIPYSVIPHTMFEEPSINFQIEKLYSATVIAKLESNWQLDELDVSHRNLFGCLENPPKNLNYLGISKCSKLTLGIDINKSDSKPVILDEGYESPSSNTTRCPIAAYNFWENLEDLCDTSSIPRTWEAKLCGQAYPVKELPYLTHAPLQVMEVLCHHFEENLSLVDNSLPARDSFRMDESEFRKKIVYLMLGIESRVFSCVNDEFRLNSYPFIDGISSDCLFDLVQPMLECGRLVRRLNRADWNPEFGPVRNTLGDQLLTSLQHYQQMVEDVMESSSLIEAVANLKTLLSSLQLMDRLWHWPGWRDNGCGVAFLQHLVDLSTLTVNEQERNLLTAYFAACVGPLLSYVERWVYQGFCCSDPHNEFFIRPNYDQLEKRDRNYWINGFAFQSINRPGAGPFTNSTAEDDAIIGLLNDVYLCGKTVHLLQLCQAKELEHKEPSLRIGLSLAELNDIRIESSVYALKFPAVVDFVPPIKNVGHLARKIRDAKLVQLLAQKEAKQLDRAVKRNARHALAKAELDEQLELKRAEKTKKENQEKLLDEDIQRYQDSIDKREADEKRRLLIKYTNLLDDKDTADGLSEDKLNANDSRGMDEENNIVSQIQPDDGTVKKSLIALPLTTVLPVLLSIPSAKSSTSSKKLSSRQQKKVLTRDEIKTKVLWEEFGVDPRSTEYNEESTSKEPRVVISPYVPKDWSHPASVSYPFQFNFSAEPESTVLIGQEKRDWLQEAKPCEEEIRDLSLSFFVQRSLLLPIRTQCQMVNRSLMTLLTGPDHRFMQHLEALRQYLFLDNGAFSHCLVNSIGRRLRIDALGKTIQIHQLINVPSMSFILQSALNSVHADEHYASRLSFYLKDATGVVSSSHLEALECFTLRYRVGWPLNIILTEEVMDDYSQIFSFVLQLRLAAWALEDVYLNLMRDVPSRWHSVHIARHSIYQFVQTLQNYVMSQLLTLAWSEFLAELKKYGARSLDDLYELHSNYIHRAKSRLLLTPKSASLLKIIRDALNLALKFRGLLLAANYTYSDVLQSQINSVSAKAREYAKFIRLILEKVQDRSHQSHFNELLVKLNFNEFYSN